MVVFNNKRTIIISISINNTVARPRVRAQAGVVHVPLSESISASIRKENQTTTKRKCNNELFTSDSDSDEHTFTRGDIVTMTKQYEKKPTLEHKDAVRLANKLDVPTKAV
jgi:hypothetical protein